MIKPQKTRSQISDIPYRENSRSCAMCGNPYTTPKGVVNKYQFRQCHRCLFIFCPLITPEYLQMLYQQGYSSPIQKVGEAAEEELTFVDKILGLLPKKEGLRIMDFGTGQSKVPELLRNQGHLVIALDVRPPVQVHSDRLTGDLLQLNLENEQFDLVYSYQVFEHLPQPKPFLDKLFMLTKPEGLVLIHTDMETPERDYEGFEHWEYVAPPDHCTFYRHKTFEVYLEDTPHQLVGAEPKSIIFQKKAEATA